MSSVKSLFDNFNRNYIGPKHYAESIYDYLNRSAHVEANRIRKLLNFWFQKYPDKHKLELYNRFRSGDADFYSAFWELYIYNVLLCSGFEVEIHPRVPEKETSPDFKVRKSGEDVFYLEAKVLLSNSISAEQKHKNFLFDKINEKVSHPNFFLGIKDIKSSPTSPPVRKICKYLVRKLSNANYEEILQLYKKEGLSGVPEWKFKDKESGWETIFFPIPKDSRPEEHNRRILGLVIESFWDTGLSNRIKEVIKEKVSKYGELDLPYLVAVNIIDERGVDRLNIENALFGEFAISLLKQGEKVVGKEFKRKPNGLWYGPEGPRNRRVSGVIIVINLYPWNLAKVTPILWHNPWAKRPFQSKLWKLPQYIPDENNTLKEIKGQEPWELLGLPPNWPYNS